jgi:hypothetical protein
MNLQELIEWHKENAKESRREGEEEQRSFHELAAELIERVRDEYVELLKKI